MMPILRTPCRYGGRWRSSCSMIGMGSKVLSINRRSWPWLLVSSLRGEMVAVRRKLSNLVSAGMAL